MRRDRTEWLARLLRPLATALVAGLAGLVVHSALMLAKDALRILPGFQPYEDFQRLLGGWAGGACAGTAKFNSTPVVKGSSQHRHREAMSVVRRQSQRLVEGRVRGLVPLGPQRISGFRT